MNSRLFHWLNYLPLLIAFLSIHPSLVSAFEVEKPPELQTRHNYKFSCKRPYFYLDNHTLPFYSYYGSVLPSHDNIRITQSAYGLRGSLWSKSPNPHPSWMLDVQLRVHGPGSVGGHGIAIWYTKEQGVPYNLKMEQFPTAVDPTGQSLGPVFGSVDRWDGLGIFFDTYDSKTGKRNNPLVYAILNDGTWSYTESSNPHEQRAAAACYESFRNSEHPVHAKLIYYNQTLELWIDSFASGKYYRQCFSIEKLKLPTEYYFGVSSSTGELPDDHDLVSIDLYEVDPVPRNTKHHQPTANKEELDKEAQLFQKIHDEVERAREQREEKVEHHGSRGGSAVSKETITHLQETQMHILEHIDKLGDRMENFIASRGGAGGSSGGPPPNMGSVEQKLQHLLNDMNDVRAEMSYIANVVKELAQYLSQVAPSGGHGGDQRHFAQILSELTTKMDAIHNHAATASMNAPPPQMHDYGSNSGGTSTFTTLSLFLIGQGILLFAYGVWKRRTEERSKKFI